MALLCGCVRPGGEVPRRCLLCYPLYLVAFCNILNELYVNTCRAANYLHVLGTELVPGKRGRLPTQLLSLAFLSTLGLELPHEISSPVVATVLGRTS